MQHKQRQRTLSTSVSTHHHPHNHKERYSLHYQEQDFTPVCLKKRHDTESSCHKPQYSNNKHIHTIQSYILDDQNKQNQRDNGDPNYLLVASMADKPDLYDSTSRVQYHSKQVEQFREQRIKKLYGNSGTSLQKNCNSTCYASGNKGKITYEHTQDWNQPQIHHGHKKIDMLEGAQRERQILELNRKNQELERQVTGLTSRNASLTSTLQLLKSQIELLTNTYQKQEKELQEIHSKFNQKDKELKTCQETLKKKLEMIREYDDLEPRLRELEEMQNRIDSQNKRLKEEVHWKEVKLQRIREALIDNSSSSNPGGLVRRLWSLLDSTN